MTSGTVLGAALVLFAAVVLTLGTLSLARVNPTERIFQWDNKGRGRYLGSYAVGFAAGYVGCAQLRDEHGWWAWVAGFGVVLVPYLWVHSAHQARLPRARTR